ncbi:MAG: hypothetical protein H6850_02730 [Alphaproteobacteria bacterium]|nr:MAG: hypothetical protein H6850_02730 [Alphaproteobacteria bacterium]
MPELLLFLSLIHPSQQPKLTSYKNVKEFLSVAQTPKDFFRLGILVKLRQVNIGGVETEQQKLELEAECYRASGTRPALCNFGLLIAEGKIKTDLRRHPITSIFDRFYAAAICSIRSRTLCSIYNLMLILHINQFNILLIDSQLALCGILGTSIDPEALLDLEIRKTNYMLLDRIIQGELIYNNLPAS